MTDQQRKRIAQLGDVGMLLVVMAPALLYAAIIVFSPSERWESGAWVFNLVFTGSLLCILSAVLMHAVDPVTHRLDRWARQDEIARERAEQRRRVAYVESLAAQARQCVADAEAVGPTYRRGRCNHLEVVPVESVVDGEHLADPVPDVQHAGEGSDR